MTDWSVLLCAKKIFSEFFLSGMLQKDKEGIKTIPAGIAAGALRGMGVSAIAVVILLNFFQHSETYKCYYKCCCCNYVRQKLF